MWMVLQAKAFSPVRPAQSGARGGVRTHTPPQGLGVYVVAGTVPCVPNRAARCRNSLRTTGSRPSGRPASFELFHPMRGRSFAIRSQHAAPNDADSSHSAGRVGHRGLRGMRSKPAQWAGGTHDGEVPAVQRGDAGHAGGKAVVKSSTFRVTSAGSARSPYTDTKAMMAGKRANRPKNATPGGGNGDRGGPSRRCDHCFRHRVHLPHFEPSPPPGPGPTVERPSLLSIY